MADRAQVRMVSAKFDLPEVFVRAYHDDLTAWGRNLSKVGRCARIILRRIPAAPVAVDGHGEIPMFGVDLVAAVERISADEVRLRIEAGDEQSERLIALHSEDIARYGMPEARKRAPDEPAAAVADVSRAN